MSTAIMPTGGVCWDYNKFHGDWNDSNDVGDIQLKDQYSYGSIAHQQQPQTIGTNRVGAQTMRNSVSSINISANGLHTLPNGMSIGTDAQLLQNQIAVIQQQQQQQQKMLHNALTRTISHQPTNSDLQLLQSNLDSNLISSNDCHRKLERTQSEPAPQVNSQVNTSRYKTELCRPFKETGECKYGEKCQFAHGENELRTVQRHPKYKTEYCRTFYGVGLCPYGSRCHFLHDLSDDDNTRAHGNRANGNRNESAAIPTANGRIAHQNGYSRNITSAEVDAITKAARFIGTIKDEPMPMANRAFARSASLMNTNAIASIGGVHPLPMSPPLSMSTGSDRASPICSLSPTNSIASFPFTEQNPTYGINNLTNGIYSSNSLPSPPPSPPACNSMVTPPPTPILAAAGATTTKSIPINMNCISNAEKPRLPIFNQISCASTIDTLKNLPL